MRHFPGYDQKILAKKTRKKKIVVRRDTKEKMKGRRVEVEKPQDGRQITAETNFNKKFCGGPGGGFTKEPPGRRRHLK